MSYAQINGTKYSQGSILICNVIDDEPVFGKIIDLIITENDTCLFVLNAYKVNTYNQHYNAYEVDLLDETVICEHKDFADYHLLCINKSFNIVEPLLSGHKLTKRSIYRTSWTVKKLFRHSYVIISNMASSRVSSSSDADVPSKKRKRKVVSIEKKLEICRKHKMGQSYTSLSKEYGLGKSTVHDIVQSEDRLTKYALEMQHASGPKRSIIRRSMQV